MLREGHRVVDHPQQILVLPGRKQVTEALKHTAALLNQNQSQNQRPALLTGRARTSTGSTEPSYSRFTTATVTESIPISCWLKGRQEGGRAEARAGGRAAGSAGGLTRPEPLLRYSPLAGSAEMTWSADTAPPSTQICTHTRHIAALATGKKRFLGCFCPGFLPNLPGCR